jgi:MraZ protein
VLRGSYPAKIDDKGRLKIPTAFKALVEEQHGAAMYLTSLSGESVRLYPMPVWLAIEGRLTAMPSTHPARLKFLDRVSYYGQTAEFDSQSRTMRFRSKTSRLLVQIKISILLLQNILHHIRRSTTRNILIEKQDPIRFAQRVSNHIF